MTHHPDMSAVIASALTPAAHIERVASMSDRMIADDSVLSGRTTSYTRWYRALKRAADWREAGG